TELGDAVRPDESIGGAMHAVAQDLIAQPGINIGQDRHMQMVIVQNLGIQNVGNQNGLIVVLGIANYNVNPIGNGNVVAARAEGNGNGKNGDIDKIEEIDQQRFKFLKRPKSREEVYFSNASKMATVSNIISIPNDELSGDTSPSVARKFLNEVKDTLVTLQHVVKHRMNGNVTNVLFSSHQEINKIFKDEIVPIVNQVDARVQNFKNHFVKEAAKFVRDFKSLAKEAGDSLDKIKALKFEIERLLRAVFSQDIIDIMQNNSVVNTSDLQTELDCTKEKLETCVIKKDKEYYVLWND
ncbi:hypothetical protein Tco_0980173, partial [Tanacetum coccineum]